jgi:shikimate kinase
VLEIMVSPLGFEPRTQGLKVPRSATELRAHVAATIPGRPGRAGYPVGVDQPAAPTVGLVLLVGMMGAGKSAVGRAVAARLGWPSLDNDDLVRTLSGLDAPALVAIHGVDELHRVELAALEEVLRHPGPLVATAAGFAVAGVAATRFPRERTTVVWLRARADTLRARIGDGADRRADAVSEPWLAETAARRAGTFAAVADVVLDVDDTTVEDVVASVVAEIQARS